MQLLMGENMFSLSGRASGSPMTGYFSEELTEIMIAVGDQMDEIIEIIVGDTDWLGDYYAEVHFTSRGLDEFWRRVNEVKNA